MDHCFVVVLVCVVPHRQRLRPTRPTSWWKLLKIWSDHVTTTWESMSVVDGTNGLASAWGRCGVLGAGCCQRLCCYSWSCCHWWCWCQGWMRTRIWAVSWGSIGCSQWWIVAALSECRCTLVLCGCVLTLCGWMVGVWLSGHKKSFVDAFEDVLDCVPVFLTTYVGQFCTRVMRFIAVGIH